MIQDEAALVYGFIQVITFCLQKLNVECFW